MSRKLRRKEVREIESALGVFFDKISPDYKNPTERFDVYANNEEENFIGTVTAYDLFFYHDELVGKTIELMGNKTIKEEE